MRATNIETGVMVKVVERRGEKLLIIHPGNGQEMEVPANLYKWSPRCLAERDMRQQKDGRRNRWQFRQAVEARRQEEEELKEKVRRGEIRAIIFKGGVFPILDGDGLVVRLLDEAKQTEKPWLRKKIEEEIARRCKYWSVNEVFDETWKAEMDWAYQEWVENEKVVERLMQ
jgi:hypothetical protein